MAVMENVLLCYEATTTVWVTSSATNRWLYFLWSSQNLPMPLSVLQHCTFPTMPL